MRDTGKDRMFSDEQLREMSEPPCEKALAALDAGDDAAVIRHLEAMRQGPASLNALGIPIMTGFIEELTNDFGLAKAEALLERIGRNIVRSFADDFKWGDEKPAISDLVSIFKYQQGAGLAVHESDDEVTVFLSPCGTGAFASEPAREGNGGAGPGVGFNSFCRCCKACQRAFNEAVGAEVWSTEVDPQHHGRCTMRFKKVKGKDSLFFTSAQLHEITLSNLERALHRMRLGNRDIAPLLKDQHREWLPWHDFMCATIGYLFGTCYVEGGADYLDRKLAAAYNPAFTFFYPYYDALDDEGNVRALCTMHWYHMMSFTLTEEEHRFVFTLDPCGSGGRLYRGEFWRGIFRYGGEVSPLIAQPHVVGFQRENFPVYCTHCSSHNRDQIKCGRLWFVNDGLAQREPGMPCVQYYYKKGRTEKLDPALRAQVGLR